jgi:hypothetical protein
LLSVLQMRKAANRMNFDFNVAEDEYIDGDEVVGLGSINKEGSGRLRLVASQQKVTEPCILLLNIWSLLSFCWRQIMMGFSCLCFIVQSVGEGHF